MPKSLGQVHGILTRNTAVCNILEHAFTGLSISHPPMLAEVLTTLHSRLQWRDVEIPLSSKTQISGLSVDAQQGHTH